MATSLIVPRTPYDVAIVGAGPVGLALAIELARAGLATLVVDRRPPLSEDAQARPQLLVARAADLANLIALGVDVREPRLVSRLATRCEADLATGRALRGDVLGVQPMRARDLWALAGEPPLALVPIGRLQRALLGQALRHGADVRYGCDVVRVRRHARAVSLRCGDGTSIRAALAILATGAARALIPAALAAPAGAVDAPQRMIGGLFDVGGDRGRWIRVELPVAGLPRPSRCTVLQTAEEGEAGTALLVDPQLGPAPTDEQLHVAFAAAARAHGLGGAGYLVAPQIFGTAVTAVHRRVIAGDNRAPIVIAGDAAQTGHVFTGQTCFVNLALALRLAAELGPARRAIRACEVNDGALVHALARYEAQSEIGAAILARASQRHVTMHLPGAWALAGVARA